MKSTRFLTVAVCLLGMAPALANAQAKPKDTKKKKPKTEEPAPPPAPVKKTLAESLTGQAKSDYDSGITLYRQTEYAAASAKFVSAYDTSKDARLLWNAAAAEKQLHHYAKARTYVRQYVQLGVDLSDKDKTDAADLVVVLDKLISDVTISVNEPGATIVIDGETVGESPLAKPLALDSGTRAVKVEKAGFLPFQSSVVVNGGAAQTVEVKLQPHVKDGRIAVRASQADATILLDRQAVGTGTYSGIIPSGAHQLGVTKDGYKPYELSFNIAENGTRSFDVTLEKKKGPLPVWAMIVGGVLVAGIATTVIVIAAKPENTRAPIPDGTFPPNKVVLTSFGP